MGFGGVRVKHKRNITGSSLKLGRQVSFPSNLFLIFDINGGGGSGSSTVVIRAQQATCNRPEQQLSEAVLSFIALLRPGDCISYLWRRQVLSPVVHSVS